MGKSWYRLDFEKRDKLFENERGVLLSFPSNTVDEKYREYKFWHRIKMVKEENGKLKVSFTDDWNFRIFKNDENRNKVDEHDITAKEFYKIITGKDLPEKKVLSE